MNKPTPGAGRDLRQDFQRTICRKKAQEAEEWDDWMKREFG